MHPKLNAEPCSSNTIVQIYPLRIVLGNKAKIQHPADFEFQLSRKGTSELLRNILIEYCT